MVTKTKTYDAVAEVRKIRDRLAKQMMGMSSGERVRFVQERLEQAKGQRQDSES